MTQTDELLDSAYCYCVTALRSECVVSTVVGNFTSAHDVNLIVVKLTHIEVYVVHTDGLKLHADVPVWGRLQAARRFRPQKEPQDLLFILTAKRDAAVLSFATGDGLPPVQTRASCNVSRPVGREADTGVIVAVDPMSNMIGARVYDGLLTVLEYNPADANTLRSTDIRFDDLNVIDLTFLHGYKKPTIAYIHQESMEKSRHLRSVHITRDYEFQPGPLAQENIHAEASMIVAVPKPATGCIVIGQQSISYHRTNGDYVAITPHALGQSTVQCCTMIDPTGDRFLLADMSGRLFLLLLERVPTSGAVASTSDSTSVEEESPVSTLRLELLGEAAIAEDIAYVGDGVFYIGSRMGDSQLIKLVSDEPMEQSDNATPAFVQQLSSFANIGPILDMVLIDNDAQTYMITASNAFKEGSLRIIRNGIGIQELASTELPAVKGIWSVAFGMDAIDETGAHNMLVVAFLERTALLRLDGAEMEAIELQCLPSNEQALLACNVRARQKNCLLVVTSKHVRLLDASAGGKGALLDEYTCEETKPIALCAANEKANQLVVCSGQQITYMRIDSESAKIEVQRTATLEHEIACVDIALLEPNAPSTLCCVGLWQDMSVRVLTLPDLEGIHTETIGGDVLIRSVMLARFEAQTYLLCALGDGQVYYFQYEKNSVLMERKKVTLGTQPVQLRRYGEHVFVCSDRPTIIYSLNQKLVFANVNVKHVAHMCALDSAAYRRALVICDADTMTIGQVDEIQKMHIRTVPLGESPRRIAYQPETNSLAVLTLRTELRKQRPQGADESTVAAPVVSIPARASASTLAPNKSSPSASGQATAQRTRTGDGDASAAGSSGQSTEAFMPSLDSDEIEVHSVLILDANTYEVQHAHELGPNEYALSIISTTLGDDQTPYYVVGTAIVLEDEVDTTSGRLIVFQYMQDGRLQLVHEKEIRGAPYCLLPFGGTTNSDGTKTGVKVLAAINSVARLFEWSHGSMGRELSVECAYFNFTVCLYLKARNDFILAGDLQRSITVLQYKKVESSLEEVAKESKPDWMVAVEMLDDHNYIGAENAGNLFSSHYNSAAASDEERARLNLTGAYHLGDQVNVMRHGTLLTQQRQMHTSAVMNEHDKTYELTSTPVMMGTVHGGLHLLLRIDRDVYNVLSTVQNRLSDMERGVGNIEWKHWRTLQADHDKCEPFGFVDGDLLERVPDMSPTALTKLVDGLKWSPQLAAAIQGTPPPAAQSLNEGDSSEEVPMGADDLVKLIEELARMH